MITVAAVAGVGVAAWWYLSKKQTTAVGGPTPPAAWDCTACKSHKGIFVCSNLPKTPVAGKKPPALSPKHVATIRNFREPAYDDVQGTYVNGADKFWFAQGGSLTGC